MEIPNTITALIDESTQAQAEFRPHFGVSLIGHHCDRYLWLNFRWALGVTIHGRTMRIFRRGQDEEAKVVHLLRNIGISVTHTGAKQERVDLGCHVSGSVDRIIAAGVPDAPKKDHILEIKTSNKANFTALQKDGVQKSKPMHYAQMQCYMHGTGIDRALYVVVCKDDDSIYTERVKHDPKISQKLIKRGHRIATADRMPEPVSSDPSWYQCKMCDYSQFCHNHHMTDQVNCRTCAHSTPEPDGTWTCERYKSNGIPLEYQRKGCDCHVLHPDLVPWQQKDSGNPHEAIYIIDGQDVRNGEPCAFCYSSRELIASPTSCVMAHHDQNIEQVRSRFDGQIVADDFDSSIPF